MTTDEKCVYWQQHFENWQQNQLPQKAYCQQQSLSYANFGYWRTRLKRTKASRCHLTGKFEHPFKHMVGGTHHVRSACNALGQHWVQGIGQCERLFSSS